MRYLILVLVLMLSGCGVRSWKPTAIIEVKPTEDPEVKRRAEREQLLADLRSADALLASWIVRLKNQDEHFEGLTDPDSWGNLILVSYRQDGVYEVVEVRSKGPDGAISGDDLIRTSRRINLLGAHNGFGYWPVVLLSWLVCAFVALAGTKIKGKHKRKHHPVFSSMVVILASPIIVIAYSILMVMQTIYVLFGADSFVNVDLNNAFEVGFDLFDFDFDFDFDLF